MAGEVGVDQGGVGWTDEVVETINGSVTSTVKGSSSRQGGVERCPTGL